MGSTSVTDDDLDQALLSHLANISSYLDLYHHLDNSLKSGRILLARTRCSSLCGSAKISQVSYNSAEMASHGATTRVHVQDPFVFDIVDELDPFDNHVVSANSSKTSTVHKVSDPINWFCGVLVPPQLRLAQLSFRRTLRLVAELATRRAILLHSAKQLENLFEARESSENVASLISLNDGSFE